MTTTILAQRIELDNKNKTIEMMQKALNQQRELTVYHAKEMEKDGEKKMELLRTEYESRIQRHQAFIDQVLVLGNTQQAVCTVNITVCVCVYVCMCECMHFVHCVSACMCVGVCVCVGMWVSVMCTCSVGVYTGVHVFYIVLTTFTVFICFSYFS